MKFSFLRLRKQRWYQVIVYFHCKNGHDFREFHLLAANIFQMRTSKSLQYSIKILRFWSQFRSQEHHSTQFPIWVLNEPKQNYLNFSYFCSNSYIKMEENKLSNGYDKCIAIIYSLQVYRSSFNTHLSIFLEKIDMNFKLLCKVCKQ